LDTIILAMHHKLHLRMALLYVNIAAYGTQAFLAETARPRVERRSVIWLAGVRRVGKTCRQLQGHSLHLEQLGA